MPGLLRNQIRPFGPSWMVPNGRYLADPIRLRKEFLDRCPKPRFDRQNVFWGLATIGWLRAFPSVTGLEH